MGDGQPGVPGESAQDAGRRQRREELLAERERARELRERLAPRRTRLERLRGVALRQAWRR